MVLYPEDIIDAGPTESSDECAGLCYASDGCSGFTWYDNTTALPNRCFLFTICEDTLPCQHCTSGRISCVASPQCYNYKVLDEESRNVKSKGDGEFCDKVDNDRNCSPGKWEGAGYYRFMQPAGIMIPTSDPGSFHCGTLGTGWINGTTDSLPVGEETSMEMCFSWINPVLDSCHHRDEVRVTRCPEGYYVYYLKDAPAITYRYCSSMN